MWARVLSLFALAGLALFAMPASAVTIDWVFVGDPGNAPDTATNCAGNPFAAGDPDCGSAPYSYYVSKHEVTNAQYAEFLNAKAASDPLKLYDQFMGAGSFPPLGTLGSGGIERSGTDGSYTYTVNPGFENKPVVYVSFWDAMRFTNWLHNGQGSGDTETGAYTLLGGTENPSNWQTAARNPDARIVLPTENEWYKAAYYDGLTATYFDYPTGTNVATVCAVPGADTGNSANCAEVVSAVAALALTEVGAYALSASPYGTFDQGGNVSEWNEDAIGNQNDSRGFRGGTWRGEAGLLAASGRNGTSPSSAASNLGFRVVSLVPEPGTIVLVAAGLAGLSWTRRRS